MFEAGVEDRVGSGVEPSLRAQSTQVPLESDADGADEEEEEDEDDEDEDEEEGVPSQPAQQRSSGTESVSSSDRRLILHPTVNTQSSARVPQYTTRRGPCF